VLIATVFLFLSLTRQRELDALKAAGISLYRASLPILLVAGAISVLAVAFQEMVLPDINAKSEEVDRVKIRGQLPRHLQRQTQIWYRSSDTRFFRMAGGRRSLTQHRAFHRRRRGVHPRRCGRVRRGHKPRSAARGLVAFRRHGAARVGRARARP